MIKKYGFLGVVRLFFSLIYTKLNYSNARLIRLPFDIRNKKYIKIGDQFTSGFGCRIEAFPGQNQKKAMLTIGNNVQINDYVHISALHSVSIGNNVLMASKIYISDCTHGSYSGDEFDSNPNVPPIERELTYKKVEIKDNVWLGEFVTVLPGVTIGEGTIVGANSVVSKSLPSHVIAVGSPARIIKRYNNNTQKWEKIIYKSEK